MSIVLYNRKLSFSQLLLLSKCRRIAQFSLDKRFFAVSFAHRLTASCSSLTLDRQTSDSDCIADIDMEISVQIIVFRILQKFFLATSILFANEKCYCNHLNSASFRQTWLLCRPHISSIGGFESFAKKHSKDSLSESSCSRHGTLVVCMSTRLQFCGGSTGEFRLTPTPTLGLGSGSTQP